MASLQRAVEGAVVGLVGIHLQMVVDPRPVGGRVLVVQKLADHSPSAVARCSAYHSDHKACRGRTVLRTVADLQESLQSLGKERSRTVVEVVGSG